MTRSDKVASLEEAKALHARAARQSIPLGFPHSIVEVKDLKSGDVTAVALRPG
jgi:hypothetical protein